MREFLRVDFEMNFNPLTGRIEKMTYEEFKKLFNTLVFEASEAEKIAKKDIQLL